LSPWSGDWVQINHGQMRVGMRSGSLNRKRCSTVAIGAAGPLVRYLVVDSCAEISSKSTAGCRLQKMVARRP
jgi:hypothetical protein